MWRVGAYLNDSYFGYFDAIARARGPTIRGRIRSCKQSFERLPRPECLSYEFVGIPFVGEIEAVHHVECFAIECAQRQKVRGDVQNHLVLSVGFFQRLRIDVAGTESARLEGNPTV